MPEDPSGQSDADDKIKRLEAENAKLRREAARQLAELDQIIARLKEEGYTGVEIARILKEGRANPDA